MIVSVSVTQADIDEGCGNSLRGCMVARACQRILSNEFKAAVCSYLYIFSLEKWCDFNIKLPVEVLSKILQFDTWKRGEYSLAPTPFSFELDIPVEYLKIEIPQEFITV